MVSLSSMSSGAVRMARSAFSRQGLILLSLAFAAAMLLPGFSGQKASANSDCQDNSAEICFYQNINYGPQVYIYPGIGVNICTPMDVGNNQASAIKAFAVESDAVSVAYYDAGNCTGSYIVSGAKHGAGWSWIGSAWNDRISSYKILPY